MDLHISNMYGVEKYIYYIWKIIIEYGMHLPCLSKILKSKIFETNSVYQRLDQIKIWCYKSERETQIVRGGVVW